MKKIIYIFSLILVFASCSENFLDTKPITTKVNTNFYKTAADVKMAVNGIYAAMYFDEWSEP